MHGLIHHYYHHHHFLISSLASLPKTTSSNRRLLLLAKTRLYDCNVTAIDLQLLANPVAAMLLPYAATACDNICVLCTTIHTRVHVTSQNLQTRDCHGSINYRSKGVPHCELSHTVLDHMLSSQWGFLLQYHTRGTSLSIIINMLMLSIS
jgi:hypothetical protein